MAYLILIFLALAFAGAIFYSPRSAAVVVVILFFLFGLGLSIDNRNLENIQAVADNSANCQPTEVQVRFTNGRSDKIVEFKFEVGGYRKNYSEPVTFSNYISDRIIPAGESWASCWPMRGLRDIRSNERSELSWDVKLTDVTFAE